MTDEAKIAKSEYQKQWWENHPGKAKEYRDKATPEQREAKRAYMKRWREEHPDKVWQYYESYWERVAEKRQRENEELRKYWNEEMAKIKADNGG